MADLTLLAMVKNSSILETLVAAAAGGDAIPSSSGKEFLIVNNGGGGSINVTIASTENCDQGADHDVVEAVAAGARRILGPFLPASRFKDVNGKIQITYSGVTTVTVGAFKWPV